MLNSFFLKLWLGLDFNANAISSLTLSLIGYYIPFCPIGCKAPIFFLFMYVRVRACVRIHTHTYMYVCIYLQILFKPLGLVHSSVQLTN